MFVARDDNGCLYLHTFKPESNHLTGEWSNPGYKTMLRADLFPKLKFNNQPIEVEIVEKKKEQLMLPKELIKNLLKEKLNTLSKEELVDLASDIASVYVAATLTNSMCSNMQFVQSNELLHKFQFTINSTAEQLIKQANQVQQCCKIDEVLLKDAGII